MILGADLEEDFIIASLNGDLKQVKTLLEVGVYIDAKDPYGRTALICASGTGEPDVVKFLIDAGADIACKNTDDKSALDFAKENSDKKIVSLLLEAGTERNKMKLEYELTFNVVPDTWYKGEMTKVEFILKNISPNKLTVAKAITYKQFIWFRFKVIDNQGNHIASGLEDIYIITDDLPELVIETLEPGASMAVSFMICLDKKSGFDNFYDLNPGKYKISGVYRFEPDTETDGAGLYHFDMEKKNIWTGVVMSEPVEVTVLEKK